MWYTIIDAIQHVAFPIHNPIKSAKDQVVHQPSGSTLISQLIVCSCDTVLFALRGFMHGFSGATKTWNVKYRYWHIRYMCLYVFTVLSIPPLQENCSNGKGRSEDRLQSEKLFRKSLSPLDSTNFRNPTVHDMSIGTHTQIITLDGWPVPWFFNFGFVWVKFKVIFFLLQRSSGHNGCMLWPQVFHLIRKNVEKLRV